MNVTRQPFYYILYLKQTIYEDACFRIWFLSGSVNDYDHLSFNHVETSKGFFSFIFSRPFWLECHGEFYSCQRNSRGHSSLKVTGHFVKVWKMKINVMMVLLFISQEKVLSSAWNLIYSYKDKSSDNRCISFF